MVAQAQETFEQALDHVKPVAAAVVSKLKDLGPKATEIKFGIKLTADAGAIFTSVGGEVNFEITVKWSKDGAD